ncbi:MAG TPA: Mu transposase C-terminal domain-containing protein, partial [Armatimonadota bacterium]|nr:Mu transposase C-terminal domain-containing protein [Armatimonadota bacterium]
QCVMDERTRAYMAAHYVRTADRGTYAKLIFNACRRQSDVWPMCGVPETLLGDWGKVFKSDMARGALEAMGVKEGDCRPYHPEGKGKVERGFRTIHTQFERMQPGWCPGDNKGDDAVDPTKAFRQVDGVWVDPRMDDQALLTLDELNARLQEWIVAYHSQHHSTIGKTPLTMWQYEIRLRADLNVEPADDILFRMLLVPVDGYTRRVERQSIRYNNLVYFDERLGDYEGVPIQVRYCYDDLKHVWCFDERGRYICEAELLETFIVDDEMDKRKFDEMARRARAGVKADKEAVERVLAKPHAVVDLHEQIHEQAESAPVPLAPTPGKWDPPADPDADRREAISEALLHRRAANE